MNLAGIRVILRISDYGIFVRRCACNSFSVTEPLESNRSVVFTSVIAECNKLIVTSVVIALDFGNKLVAKLNARVKVTERTENYILFGHSLVYLTVVSAHPVLNARVVCEEVNVSSYGKEAANLVLTVDKRYLIDIKELNGCVNAYGNLSAVPKSDKNGFKLIKVRLIFLKSLREVLVCLFHNLAEYLKEISLGYGYGFISLEHAVATIEIGYGFVHILLGNIAGCFYNVILCGIVVRTELIGILFYLLVNLLVGKIFKVIVNSRLLCELEDNLLTKCLINNLLVVNALKKSYDIAHSEVLVDERNDVVAVLIEESEYLVLQGIGNHSAFSCSQNEGCEFIGNKKLNRNLAVFGNVEVNVRSYDIHYRLNLCKLCFGAGKSNIYVKVKVAERKLNAKVVGKKSLEIFYRVVCHFTGHRNLLKSREDSLGADAEIIS